MHSVGGISIAGAARLKSKGIELIIQSVHIGDPGDVATKVFAHHKVRADGSNTLFLRVIIERKKREFNLKVCWPVAFFDITRQEAKPRYPKDQELESINMVINEAKGRASRIKLRYFSDGRLLTLDLFQKEFESYESRDNFLFYWQTKMETLYNKGNIGAMTKVRQNTNISRFKEFLGNATFSG